MIQIKDSVENRVVANGNAIIALAGANNVGVTAAVVVPGQRLQTRYSYLLIDTVAHTSVSAECTALPGAGMQIASFHLN